MRVFRAIVEPTANFVTVGVADLFHRCKIRAKPVSDDALRLATFLYDALHKLERCGLVPLRGDHGFQNLAFVIDSPPKIAELAVDLHKHLIQMPTPLGKRRRCATRFFRISAANIGPNRFHQKRMVSWLMSIPRPARRSSTFRSDSGYRTYIITTRRITSGELLKYRNGLRMAQSHHGQRRPEELP